MAGENDDGPVTVWILYRLKPGVSREEYQRWSREVDQPSASRQPGIRRYEIYEVQGAGDGESPADIVEVIEADSWEAWLAVDKAPDMKDAVNQFWEICQPDSVQEVYGRRIEPA